MTGEKRNRGRQPGYLKPEARRKQIVVRCTEEELHGLQVIAKAGKISLSDLVRMRLFPK